MDIIGIIAMVAAVIGAIVGIISLRDSRRNIIRRLDKKEAKIRQIDHELVLRYGLNQRHGGLITPLHAKRDKLQADINELKRLL